MILPDVNLLIYAIDSDSPHHRGARKWLEEVLSSTTLVGLAWIVILAFLRITTRAGILVKPMSPEEAIDYCDSWLQRPYVKPLNPGEHHWAIFRNLIRSTGTAGNLSSDAHLAALALEHGCVVYSTDNDFKRFPGIKHVNPLVE